MTQVHKALDGGSAMLAAIGRSMDRDAYPEVMDGGYVRLGDTRSPLLPPPSNARTQSVRFQGRSQAGQGQGPAAGQGKTAASAPEGSSGDAAPFFREGQLTKRGRRELEGVGRAYELLVRSAPNRTRVFWRAGLVEGLTDRAHFLTDLSTSDGRTTIATWGWWDHGIRIGPRHTNYDGSACVFEARDLSWTHSSPLLDLFDMTTVWAVRHLHLRRLGTWPGRQILHTAFERLTETMPGELCGCGELRTYAACCEENDRTQCPIEVARRFAAFTGGKTRRLRIPPLVEA
jgi:hypothetical protein